MSTDVKARIVRIGNSRGIRIPKVWLERLGLTGEVILTVENDKLVIRPAHPPRHGWEEMFRAMAEAGDDQLLDEQAATQWESEEWEW